MTSCSLRFLKINQGDRNISCFSAVTKWKSNGSMWKNGSGEVLFIQGSECQSFHAHLSSQRAPLGVSPKPRCIIQDANSSHQVQSALWANHPLPVFQRSPLFSHTLTTLEFLLPWLTQWEKGAASCPGTTWLWNTFYVLFMVRVRESAITDKSS